MTGGIALILASQMVAAGQLLLDQSVYSNRLQLSPLKVVGCQGLLGVVITVSRTDGRDLWSVGCAVWGLQLMCAGVGSYGERCGVKVWMCACVCDAIFTPKCGAKVWEHAVVLLLEAVQLHAFH